LGREDRDKEEIVKKENPRAAGRSPLEAINPSRRRVVGGSVALAAAGLCGPRILRAGGMPTIRIGHVSPITGFLAGFAEAQTWVLESIRRYLDKGLDIGGRTYRIEIITRDSQSDQSRAADVASDLILKDKVDILTASSGSINVNPVANIAELNEVPCITTDNPWESYYYGRRGTAIQGFEWTYHFFWGLEQVLAAFIGQWQAQDTNRQVGVLFNTAQDDTSWHNAFVPAIEKAGFTVVDPGQFPAFGNDFTPQIGLFKRERVEIVSGNLISSDFSTFWAQCAQQGFKPKVVSLGKAFLFPADVASLGDRALNVCCEVWWSPHYPYKSSLTGISCRQLADNYEAATGRHWTQPIPFKHALFEVVIDVLRRTLDPKDGKSILQAIRATDLPTIVGPIKWTGSPVKNVCTTPVVAGQWQKHAGRLDIEIVNSGAFPEIMTTSKPLTLA
jgi:branched-chain amino acid transport system substrate-binding protein